MIRPALPRLRPDPLPLPDVGRPPRDRLCPEGTPPIGLEFLGATATLGGYLLPCPCCVQGWALLLPTGEPYGYRVALEHGCSRGCAVEDIARWHLVRCGELPRDPPPPPDERARRYGAAVVRGELRRLLESPPADRLGGLRRAAFVAGQFLDGTVKLARWVARRRGSRLSGRDDASRPIALRRPPVPAGGHQPRGLALLPLPARPADGRGAAGRPRHHRQPRDRAPMGAEVRPGLRERDPPAAAPSRR